jgi:hypothetical protein
MEEVKADTRSVEAMRKRVRVQVDDVRDDDSVRMERLRRCLSLRYEPHPRCLVKNVADQSDSGSA